MVSAIGIMYLIHCHHAYELPRRCHICMCDAKQRENGMDF